ncbi:hypothetical protein RND64_04330 [Gordonia sp. w5E2]
MTFALGDRVRVIGTTLYGHVAAHLTPLISVDLADGDRGLFAATELEHLD